MTLTSTAQTSKSITVDATCNDGESGVAKYEFYIDFFTDERNTKEIIRIILNNVKGR